MRFEDIGCASRLDAATGALLVARIGCTLPHALDLFPVGEAPWFDGGKLGGIVEEVSDPRGLCASFTRATRAACSGQARRSTCRTRRCRCRLVSTRIGATSISSRGEPRSSALGSPRARTTSSSSSAASPRSSPRPPSPLRFFSKSRPVAHSSACPACFGPPSERFRPASWSRAAISRPKQAANHLRRFDKGFLARRSGARARGLGDSGAGTAHPKGPSLSRRSQRRSDGEAPNASWGARGDTLSERSPSSTASCGACRDISATKG